MLLLKLLLALLHDSLHSKQIILKHVKLDMQIELPLRQIFGDRLQGLTCLQQPKRKELQEVGIFDVQRLQLLLQVKVVMLLIHTNL